MAGKGTQTPAYWYDGSPFRDDAPAGAAVRRCHRAAPARLSRGWRKRHSLPVPVIVVGNITAGGTGKTPLTIAWSSACARRLEAGRGQPWLWSRRRDKPLWVQADTPTAKGGDEPVLIAWKTGVPVRVDRDRVAAGKALVEAAAM